MKNNIILNWYRDKFQLDIDTRNNLAQQNFDIFRILNIFQIFITFLNLILLVFYNRHNLSFFTKTLYINVFFCITSILLLIYYYIVKNTKSKFSRFLKNLPFYLYTLILYGISIAAFFYSKNFVDGAIIYETVNVVVILFFNYNPLIYLPYQLIPFIIMQPTIFKFCRINTITYYYLLTIIIIIYSFYKRTIIKNHSVLLKSQKQNLQIITFGNFTIINNQNTVKFQRKKSLELLAYLVYKNGSSVDSKELMTILWGDNATSEEYGSSLRNLFVDIKQTLKKLNILDFFIAEYNSFRINPSSFECDYYDFLKGDSDAVKSYNGEFMNQFEWAADVADYLDNLF